MAALYYFIINPKSGSSVDISCIRHLRDHLRLRNQRVQLHLTRSLHHAAELAADAIEKKARVLIVSGGDGTVRTVAEAMAGVDIPILIIPSGTENLLACELGLDRSEPKIIETLEKGKLRKIDLGRANGRYFMAIVGVGFDAEVVNRVHNERSGHIAHSSYVWPICRMFWEYRFPHLRIEADGELLCDEPALAFVSNISRYAVGLGISRQADCSDGLLDICIYKCDNQLGLLCHSLLTVRRLSERSKRVVRRKCRTISVSSTEAETPVQLDGDPSSGLPIKIEVVPAAVQVLTPPAPKHSRYHPPVRFYHLKRWLLG